MGDLRRLVDQSVWANRRWVDYVYSRQDSETRPRELLGHIVVGERVWFERIDGQRKEQVMFPVLPREELLQRLDENHERFVELISNGRLEEVFNFRRGTGEEYHARIVDAIYHLLTHGYHHRGQIAMYYAGKGVTDYPGADHIDFLMAERL